jgi:Set1/Ash2 histone methyltransferase complex subunit ASH2
MKTNTISVISVRTRSVFIPKSKSKSRRDENNIWTRSTSRKHKNKKPMPQPAAAVQPWPSAAGAEECVPGQLVLLSRVFKSERILLSADRLTTASSKGYRMVRATHNVAAGAWYFEVKVMHLGSTGHTRLGWATNMADIDMPVGCGAYGFGYRDIEGAKVHISWRDNYGDEGYGKRDVLGFYISLPHGKRYEPQVNLNNKGKPFLVQGQDALAHVPGE